MIANAIVIAVDQGMPVSCNTLAEAGYPTSFNVAAGHFYKHVITTAHTTLSYLGDIISPHLGGAVLSPGDILMLLGITVVAWQATCSCDRR